MSLFPELVFPSTLPTLIAPRPCRCGCTTARLGSSQAMHAGRLTCEECGSFVGWASHALVAEIRASSFATGLSSFDLGERP